MKKILLLLLSVFFGLLATAQDVSSLNIKWSSVKTVTTGEPTPVNENTYLIASGTDHFDWKDKGDHLRKSFRIIEVIGQWSNVEQDGTLQYEVTDGIHSGSIVIYKKGNETKAVITMLAKPTTVQELSIVSVLIL